MNILFHACSAAIKSKSRSLVGYHSTCRISINSALESLLVRSYSSAMTKRDGSKEKKKNASKGEKKNGSKGGKKNGSQGKKPDHAHAPKKKDEKNAFFVVRKGGLVGIYKSLNDCQFQSGSSNCDPPVSVYKGYSMTKKTKKYLNSRGIKDALYSLSAKDFTENLFGTLLPCTLKYLQPSCMLECDGSSKANGQAGAGAVLRADNGSVICRLREGLGTADSTTAEYRAIILGLKYALRKGFAHIRVQGDSQSVCMQIQDQVKVKSPSISSLCEQAKQLKASFQSFQIKHVPRKSNCEADKLASLGAELPDGQIEEEMEK
ncbi:unnamed protein product [Cuscuta europaea]|uniref:RNase H type-1 domain-containing protein n=1 Tax=Cuscuta europaea TaxID=41803 RepID=A0A9P0Z8X5_CUSEU|nr:unnamed protein product [Cuscuta europaea]